ncbi:alpha/beta hydrolase [Salisediminibacterium beveridgei]|uniref:alpha/beta hydrolase n=1 Tax=Salisediminibacterium beveridgei TaxID=632773 RepID=UPI00084829CD|nr:carboxylesterase [Salisediminibacterium beveridgei]
MKINQPEPFTFEGGNRAVLLLHGFTGNSADVRMLGRYLNKQGYTCHAPHMRGHGVPPEELVKYGPDDWYDDVKAAYQFLLDQGYDEIAVGGLSMGGVMSLKLGMEHPVKGIFPMAAPMFTQGEERMHQGVLHYAKEYKQLNGMGDEQVEKEMRAFEGTPLPTIRALHTFIEGVRQDIDLIYTPTLIAQGLKDEVVDPESARWIHDHVETDQKELFWYKESGHVVTLDQEKEQLHKDVYAFLEKLDWQDKSK